MWEPVPLVLVALGCVFAVVDELTCPGPISDTTATVTTMAPTMAPTMADTTMDATTVDAGTAAPTTVTTMAPTMAPTMADTTMDATTVDAGTAAPTTDSWFLHRISGMCYKMFTLKEESVFDRHSASCEMLGYHLAQPRTWAQNEFLVDHVSTSGVKYIGIRSKWLSNFAQYKWCFYSDNTPYVYDYVALGVAPNSEFDPADRQINNKTDACISLQRITNKWEERQCTQFKTRYHVCEVKANNFMTRINTALTSGNATNLKNALEFPVISKKIYIPGTMPGRTEHAQKIMNKLTVNRVKQGRDPTQEVDMTSLLEAVRDVAVDDVNEGVAKNNEKQLTDALRYSPVLGLDLVNCTSKEMKLASIAVRNRSYTRGAPLQHAGIKAAISEACPRDWVKSSDNTRFITVSCFRVRTEATFDKVDVYENGLNWFEGKAVCGNSKSRVAQPKNQAENSLITQLIRNTDADFGWLGIARPDKDVNNWQTTVDDFASVAWDNWMTGEPSDKRYHYCGKVSRVGEWSVERCDMETTDYKTVAVCQRDIVKREERFQNALAANDVMGLMDVLSNIGLVKPMVDFPEDDVNDGFIFDNYTKITFDKVKARSKSREKFTLEDAQQLFAEENLIQINELMTLGVMDAVKRHSLFDAMNMWGIKDSEDIDMYHDLLLKKKTAKVADLDESDIIKVITDKRMLDLNDVIANKLRDPHDLVILLNTPPLSDQKLEIPRYIKDRNIVEALRKQKDVANEDFTIETLRRAIQDITVASLTTPAPTTRPPYIDTNTDRPIENRPKPAHPPVVEKQRLLHGGFIVGGAMGLLTVVWVTFALFLSKTIRKEKSKDDTNSSIFSNEAGVVGDSLREELENHEAMKVMTKFMENDSLLDNELKFLSEENLLVQPESKDSAILNSRSRSASTDSVILNSRSKILGENSRSRNFGDKSPGDKTPEEIVETTSSGAFNTHPSMISVRDFKSTMSIGSFSVTSIKPSLWSSKDALEKSDE